MNGDSPDSASQFGLGRRGSTAPRLPARLGYMTIAAIFCISVYVSLITTGLLTAALAARQCPAGLLVLLFLLTYFPLTILLLVAAWSLSRSDPIAGTRGSAGRNVAKDAAVAAAIAIFAILLAEYYIHPLITFDIHTWGDEAFHIVQTVGFESFLAKSGIANANQDFLQLSGRYPVLYQFYLLHLHKIFDSSNVQALFRRGAYGPYLLTVLLCYLVPRASGLARFPSALLSVSVACQGLLLSFLISVYLELLLVPLLLAGSWLIYAALRDGSLAKFACAALIIGLAPLVKDNVLPGSLALLSAGAIAFLLTEAKVAGHWQPARTFCILGVAWASACPGVIYALAKSAFYTELVRYSPLHIWQQDYGLFFAVLLIHTPIWVMLIICVRGADGRFRSLDQFLTPGILAASALSAYLVVQLLVIAVLVPPGWSSYSRFLVLFLGPLLALGFIAIDSLQRDGMLSLRTLVAGTFATILFSTSLTHAFINKTVLYNELEIFYDFKTLAMCLQKHSAAQTVAVHIPIGKPWSFPWDAETKWNTKFLPIMNAENDPSNFTDFAAFINKVGTEASQFIFFYYRGDSLFSGTLSPNVSRPHADQLSGYQVLCEIVDPTSRGARGILLLEKAAR